MSGRAIVGEAKVPPVVATPTRVMVNDGGNNPVVIIVYCPRGVDALLGQQWAPVARLHQRPLQGGRPDLDVEPLGVVPLPWVDGPQGRVLAQRVHVPLLVGSVSTADLVADTRRP